MATSDRKFAIMSAALESMETLPKIDFKLMAEKLGLSSAASANARWCEFKRTLNAVAPAGTPAAAAGPNTTKTRVTKNRAKDNEATTKKNSTKKGWKPVDKEELTLSPLMQQADMVEVKDVKGLALAKSDDQGE